MTENDRVKFAEIISGLAEYYGKSISKPVLSLYWQGLKNYDLGAVQQAVNRCITNPDSGQFMPKIADLLRMLEGSNQDAAMIAWTKVDRAVRQVGMYTSVVFDDAIIHAVIEDMGGWISFETKTDDDWPFLANEFRRRYHGYKLRGDGDNYPCRLKGHAEYSAVKHDAQIPPPLYIGNREKAEKVEAIGASNPTPLISGNQSVKDKAAALSQKMSVRKPRINGGNHDD